MTTTALDDLFIKRSIEMLDDSEPEKKFLVRLYTRLSEYGYCDLCGKQFKRNSLRLNLCLSCYMNEKLRKKQACPQS